MREIGIIFKHNFNRVCSKKGYIFLTVALISASITFAIFFTSKFDVKGSIAYVADGDYSKLQEKGFHITKVHQVPNMSEFVMKKYDAAVIQKEAGQIEVKTIRGSNFEKEIKGAILGKDNESSYRTESRKIGTNILGYLCMFILLGSVMFMHFYNEDREKKVLNRIMSSEMRGSHYLLGHILFVFCMVYFPAFLILIIAKSMVRIDIGMSYLEYSYLLAILVLLGTSFALFVSTVINKEDNVVMFSSSVIVLTSVVSGLFFSIKNHGTIVDWLVGLLPQKQYLLFVESIESGNRIVDSIGNLLYVVTIICIFLGLSIWVHNKMVKMGKI